MQHWLWNTCFYLTACANPSAIRRCAPFCGQSPPCPLMSWLQNRLWGTNLDETQILDPAGGWGGDGILFTPQHHGGISVKPSVFLSQLQAEGMVLLTLCREGETSRGQECVWTHQPVKLPRPQPGLPHRHCVAITTHSVLPSKAKPKSCYAVCISAKRQDMVDERGCLDANLMFSWLQGLTSCRGINTTALFSSLSKAEDAFTRGALWASWEWAIPLKSQVANRKTPTQHHCPSPEWHRNACSLAMVGLSTAPAVPKSKKFVFLRALYQLRGDTEAIEKQSFATVLKHALNLGNFWLLHVCSACFVPCV